MYDSDFEKALQDHVEAHERNYHNTQLLNLWKYLNEHLGLNYVGFVNLSEEERDKLFLAAKAAENNDE
jgi:hypothetical protein